MEFLRSFFDPRVAAPQAGLIAAAILPALVLLFYIYKRDRVNKEPDMLLLALVLLGMASVFIALVLELIGTGMLSLYLEEETIPYLLLDNFIVIGAAEEGSKFLMLRLKTWRSPHFDCSFDAVVYAVFVSLGFALAENVGYVLLGGLSTALLRAATSVPGHMSFGVFMGACYSLARVNANRGLHSRSRLWQMLAVVLPALFHGSYDFICELPNGTAFLVYPFAAGMILCAFLLVRALARKDRYI